MRYFQAVTADYGASVINSGAVGFDKDAVKSHHDQTDINTLLSFKSLFIYVMSKAFKIDERHD